MIKKSKDNKYPFDQTQAKTIVTKKKIGLKK